MRVTIKDIAQELGISHSTVSRVLNDKQNALVSESTRERILSAAARMGYRPSRIAQALQGKGTQLIGVFLPDSEEYFFQNVLKNLRETLQESEYELMVFVSTTSQIASRWQRLLQWDLDGVFVFDYMFYVDGLWEAMTKHTGQIPPIVGLFSNQTQLQDYVTIDFRGAMETLLEDWLAQGKQSFGYMALPNCFHVSEQRYNVYVNFAAAHNLRKAEMPIVLGERSLMEAARQAMLHWMESRKPLPDALFCQNDEIALGAYSALREVGVCVPSQVALAGCDNVPYLSYLETPLSSLELPVQEACRQGWRILQQRMLEREGPPLNVTLEASLVVRASSQEVYVPSPSLLLDPRR